MFTYEQAKDPTQAFGILGQVATNLILGLRNVALGLSILFIIIGAIKYMTSTGDPEKAASARGTITWALAAIVITVSLWSLFILIFVSILGADLGIVDTATGTIEFFFENPETFIYGP